LEGFEGVDGGVEEAADAGGGFDAPAGGFSASGGFDGAGG
jgi:hypothetical protein